MTTSSFRLLSLIEGKKQSHYHNTAKNYSFIFLFKALEREKHKQNSASESTFFIAIPCAYTDLYSGVSYSRRSSNRKACSAELVEIEVMESAIEHD